jgi:hypothetical protein
MAREGAHGSDNLPSRTEAWGQEGSLHTDGLAQPYTSPGSRAPPPRGHGDCKRPWESVAMGADAPMSSRSAVCLMHIL